MGDTVEGLLAEYKSLFSGNTSFHGVHQYRKAKTKGKKAEGKSWTADGPLTETQYKQHLDGVRGLGVSPLREDSTCAFGAIDVDIYDNDAYCFSIVRALYKWDLPVLPFRSKSGGLHLYLFFEGDATTSKLPTGTETIRLLTRITQIISSKKNEIFPKQAIHQSGKQGNWINLPYFNTDNSQQFLIDRSNNRVSFDDAIKVILNKRASMAKVLNDLEALPFSDGPPCLQTITIGGGPEEGQGRNVYLFNAAIYLKEKDHTTFDHMLDDINERMDNPVDQPELTIIKKSVIKKEYSYACTASPLCDHCEKDQCATKKYGVGQNNGLFMGVELGQLTIVRGQGTSYEWEVVKENDTALIRFDSPRDIMNQELFMSAVLSELNFKVSRVKIEKWDKILNSSLESAVERIESLEDDNTLHGRITKGVLNFLTKHISTNKLDLTRGLAYMDKPNGVLMFRQDDLWLYLTETSKMKLLRNTDLQYVLSNLHVEGRGKVTRLSTAKVMRVKIISIPLVEKLTGGPIEPMEDINFEEEAASNEGDY